MCTKIRGGATLEHPNPTSCPHPFHPSIHITALLLSHLRPAAPEHFNACQQYVQRTCCACKQTTPH